MRVVLGYRYSRYIDLSNMANTAAVLSPFDYTLYLKMLLHIQRSWQT